MIYGYARVSTRKQILERQIKNILSFNAAAKIYSDKYTGTKMDRPEWTKLVKRVESGDTIIFDSVSRMSRNADEGIAVYEALYTKGVNLVFLNERHIDTDTYKTALEAAVPMTGGAVDCILKGVNEYLMILARQQVRLAFEQAEKEVTDLQQRTKEGLRVAMIDNEKSVGNAVNHKNNHVKKANAAKEVIRSHSRSFGGTLDDNECLKLAGCSRNSFYKYKSELKHEAAIATENASKTVLAALAR